MKVTCAIIEKEGKVLCAQRSGSMKHPYKWEFPGGKKEENESFEDCLKREIKEELRIEIEIQEQLPSFIHKYSEDFSIELFPFRCTAISGEIKLAEHQQITWLFPADLHTLDWVEADVGVVEFLLKNLE